MSSLCDSFYRNCGRQCAIKSGRRVGVGVGNVVQECWCGVAAHGGNLLCGTANSDSICCKLTSDGPRNISHRVDPKGNLSQRRLQCVLTGIVVSTDTATLKARATAGAWTLKGHDFPLAPHNRQEVEDIVSKPPDLRGSSDHPAPVTPSKSVGVGSETIRLSHEHVSLCGTDSALLLTHTSKTEDDSNATYSKRVRSNKLPTSFRVAAHRLVDSSFIIYILHDPTPANRRFTKQGPQNCCTPFLPSYSLIRGSGH